MFLEQHTFAGRIADFVWMVMLCVLVLVPIPALVPSIQIPFFGPSLVFTLLYLWSRENPNANTSIMGMITMKAFYLPWGMLGMGLVMGQDLVPDLLGIVAGHLYYFLAVLHPRAGGAGHKTPTGSTRCATAFGVKRAGARRMHGGGTTHGRRRAGVRRTGGGAGATGRPGAARSPAGARGWEGTDDVLCFPWRASGSLVIINTGVAMVRPSGS